eukprot:2435232-Rhodomonas_salina.1
METRFRSAAHARDTRPWENARPPLQHCTACSMATRFASSVVATTEWTMPVWHASCADTTVSSKYICSARLHPAVIGNERLKQKQGFAPRGRFPKLKVECSEHTLQSAANASATPPPISLPCTAAITGIGKLRIAVATTLHLAKTSRLSADVPIPTPVSVSAYAAPTQK